MLRLIANYLRLYLLATALLWLLPSVLYAAKQEPVDTFDLSLEELSNIIVGSRRNSGSITTISPVDIITASELRAQASNNIPDMLRKLVPSFNVGDHPLSGTSTAVRPASMRGLSPDHLLVLINGKRRHRSANIPTFSGGITDGSQSPDLSSIPAIALKEVQILRDGAAAQYGADAISGVFNFVLNDRFGGNTLALKSGSTFADDGDTQQVVGSYALNLGKKGFVRFSGELSENAASTRATQRNDVTALIASGNTGVPNPAIKYGTPKIKNNINTFINFELDTIKHQTIYGFSGYSKKKSISDFFYRNPTGRLGVFTDADDNGNYLIGDMTPNDGINCDGGIDFGGTGLVNNPISVGADDADSRLQAIFADENCFSVLELFPAGYTPLFAVDVSDISTTLGLRGETLRGLHYDLSLNVGRNTLAYSIGNVPNPSYGALTSTHYNNLGSRIQTEYNANLDASYPLAINYLESPLNIAAGIEWRNEIFEVTTGSLESYDAGILANQGFLIGEEAFPGFSPNQSGRFELSNMAMYVDFEADVSKKLIMDVAVRFEKFDHLGLQSTGKIAGSYALTSQLKMRSSLTTGFHAPTAAQQNISLLTNEFDENDNLIESGLIPPTHPVAQSVGGKQIQAETSISNTLGGIFKNEAFMVSIDYYHIKMKDRIAVSQSFTLSPQQKDVLLASGINSAAGLGSIRFYVNDFNTQTQGLDLVLSTPLTFISLGETKLHWSANYNVTRVTSYDQTDPNALLSAARVQQLETNNPKLTSYLSVQHRQPNQFINFRVNYFGPFTELHLNSSSLPIEAESQVTVDIEAGMTVSKNLEFIVGADNVFDSAPTENPWGFIVGSKYPTTSPAGVNGGFYYIKLQSTF